MSKLLTVRFRGTDKEYNYRVPDTFKFPVSSKVVVDSPSTGYTIVDCIRLTPERAPNLDFYKPIVCIVDDTKYKQRKEVETKRRAVRIEIGAAMQTFREQELLRMASKRFKGVRALERELKRLDAWLRSN